MKMTFWSVVIVAMFCCGMRRCHAQFDYFPIVRSNSLSTDNDTYCYANSWDSSDLDSDDDDVVAQSGATIASTVPEEATTTGSVVCVATCNVDPLDEVLDVHSTSVVTTFAAKDLFVVNESMEEEGNAYGRAESTTEWEVLTYPQDEQIEVGNLNAVLSISAQSETGGSGSEVHPYSAYLGTSEVEAWIDNGNGQESFVRAQHMGAAGWSVTWKTYSNSVFDSWTPPSEGAAMYSGDFTKTVSTSHDWGRWYDSIILGTYAENMCSANANHSAAPDQQAVGSVVSSTAAFSVSAYLEQ